MNQSGIEKHQNQGLPFIWAKQHGVLAIYGEQGEWSFLCRSGVQPSSLMEARRIIPTAHHLQLVDEETFEEALLQTYQQNSSQARQMMENLGNEMDFYSLAEELPKDGDLLDTDDDAPIIRLINAMLSEAIKEMASDIHIEPFERRLVIRFRIDGVLRKILEPQRKLAPLLVSRIKVMAKLDIAEKRIPQDGRIALRIGGRAIDVRVSTLPSSHGERVVMRLLDKNSVKLDLAQLGMSTQNQQMMSQLIQQPHGIILVTGPTGSGKSTTLYAALSQINTYDRNIMTVEDPIEYELEGIGQTQVNPKVDMTFARGLRAILRQDPDVVLIGEIRDTETAQIAVQASLTGHLVLSTLHTNTAIGAVTRLQDMGIEPFLLSSSLIGVLAQRLVRTLCPACRLPHIFNSQELACLGLGSDKQYQGYRAAGCETCNQSGYRGRTGLHELLLIDDEVRLAMQQGKSEIEMMRLIREQSQTIRQDGVEKILAGITTLEEVVRVTRED